MKHRTFIVIMTYVTLALGTIPFFIENVHALKILAISGWILLAFIHIVAYRNLKLRELRQTSEDTKIYILKVH